jgi:predicted DNA-binding protein
MLGLRIDAATEARLAAFSARTRRSKSDIARDALLRYLAEAEDADDLRRQVAAIAAAEAVSPDIELDRFLDAAFDDLVADDR